jgi:hypothetical protein
MLYMYIFNFLSFQAKYQLESLYACKKVDLPKYFVRLNHHLDIAGLKSTILNVRDRARHCIRTILSRRKM